MAQRISREDLTRRTMMKNIASLLDNNPSFRRFLWTYLRDLGIFASVYSRGSAVDTTYLVGRRDAGLELIHMLKHIRPDVLGLLEREGSLMETDSKPPQQEDTDADLSNPIPDFDPDDLEP